MIDDYHFFISSLLFSGDDSWTPEASRALSKWISSLGHSLTRLKILADRISDLEMISMGQLRELRMSQRGTSTVGLTSFRKDFPKLALIRVGFLDPRWTFGGEFQTVTTLHLAYNVDDYANVHGPAVFNWSAHFPNVKSLSVKLWSKVLRMLRPDNAPP